MNPIIPVMFCFDKNYVIPAAVAFYSLLEHANKKYFYKFYVLHSDISTEQQKELRNTLKPFKEYYSLDFINMDHQLNDVWENTKSKVHFSKEMFYKMMVSSLFPQYDRIITSDVDVVFLGDISQSYFSLDDHEDHYVAAVKTIGILKNFNTPYGNKFSPSEIEMLNSFCAGYLVFNLKKIREDDVEKKMFHILYENIDEFIYPEQDALNMCCYGKTTFLPLNYVTCTYMWYLYSSKDEMRHDGNYTYKELKNAMDHPIQLHYASTEKPWKYVDCVKSEIWFQYIVKTTFLRQYLQQLPHMIVIPEPKKEHKCSQPIRHVIDYIKMEPFFLFKPSFYKRVIKKVSKKR